MHARAVTWVGTRTQHADEMVEFLTSVLGLSQTHAGGGLVSLTTADGDTVEVFSADEPHHQHFTTGPVAGFHVDDLEASRFELRQAGVELLGEIQHGGGLAWQHFRAPDGYIWEITSRTD